MADGSPCHAYTVDSCPARAAADSNLRYHVVRLGKRRRCHTLRRCCNRQGEASNCNQSDHSLLPQPSNHSDLSQHGDGPALVFKKCPYRLPALVARTIEIDQGPYDDRAGTFSKTGDTGHDTASRRSELIKRNKVAFAREPISCWYARCSYLHWGTKRRPFEPPFSIPRNASPDSVAKPTNSRLPRHQERRSRGCALFAFCACDAVLVLAFGIGWL